MFLVFGDFEPILPVFSNHSFRFLSVLDILQPGTVKHNKPLAYCLRNKEGVLHPEVHFWYCSEHR